MGKKITLAIVMILLLPIFLPAVESLIVNQSKDIELISTNRSENPRDNAIQETIILSIGNVTLTIDVIDPSRRTLITYETDDTTFSQEIIVTPRADGYLTSIYLNGILVDSRVKDTNILGPVKLSSIDSTPPETTQSSKLFHASYTYKWWDGTRIVTGPSWQIKYPHPDRNHYSIPTYWDWSRHGSKLIHTQINSGLSGVLATLGWAVLFAAIGTYIGERSSTTYGAVIGAVLGTLFGILFGYYTQAVLADEEGCIWWWSSIAYENWVQANAWWIWFFSITGSATSFTMAAFALYGYYRVGSYTFYDAVNAGNP